MRIPIISDIHNKLSTGVALPKQPLTDYPRPNLVRDSYICLNGEWKDGILVPYCLQSDNSGYKGKVVKNFTYEKEFTVPRDFIKEKVLLHFDGVDQKCEVFLNGTHVESHEGGYNPFVVDVTKVISRVPGACNKLKVLVTDSLSHDFPYGKQKKKRGGMWYTPVTGIWKSVWMESVSLDYVRGIEFTPNLHSVNVNIDSEANDFTVEIYDGDKLIVSEHSPYESLHFEIPDPILWSPENPHLYDVVVRTPGDEVKSYFGLRTISTEVSGGVNRILLNQEPYFFHGVLVQGYYPEGIYTPNSAKEFEDDIIRLKELGINTIRMHIKVEQDLFYYACDRLGMLVFQDMVNNGSYRYFRDTVIPTFNGQKRDDTTHPVKKEVMENFIIGMEDTAVQLYNYPSVVYYTIFNEGWGQFSSDRMYDWLKSMDRTRIIDSTSGWFWQEKSDVDSYHVYFHSFNFKESSRPVILSEFGGFSLRLREHSYTKYINYGYGKCKDSEQLTKMITDTYERDVIPYIEKGLSGSIYTQAYDVEDETNGLYTYDRKICKVDKEAMLELANKLTINGK